jgi:SAM-dependent methyltransferase
MAFDFHLDIQKQYDQQAANAAAYLIPFVEGLVAPLGPGFRMLDIGCGTGGVIEAFATRDCQCVGVDLAAVTIDVARARHARRIETGQVQVLNQNIYDYHPTELFDLIVFKDSIEHIPDQRRIIGHVRKFLKPGGKVFFGFPPWYMPFGGHQQIVRTSKLFSLLPYYHLLPAPLYRGILKAIGESQAVVDELMDIKRLGLSTWQFEQHVRATGYRIARRRLYLINPIYEYKFRLKPREQWWLLGQVPFVRDFFTTCAYYLIEPLDSGAQARS